ncbi:MAG: hypothetical protein AB7O04_12825 [Hyphomonadaceae bacterium]
MARSVAVIRLVPVRLEVKLLGFLMAMLRARIGAAVIVLGARIAGPDCSVEVEGVAKIR